MRLYSRLGATSHTRDGVTWTPEPDGSFSIPDEAVAREMLACHSGGVPMWEDEIGFRQRVAAEELERRRDPATLMTAVEQIVGAARQAGTGENPEVTALRDELAELRKQLAAKEDDGSSEGDGKKTPARRISGAKSS